MDLLMGTEQYNEDIEWGYYYPLSVYIVQY